MTDAHPIAAAIADLEARRVALGDAVVDAAIAALRSQIAAAPAPAPAAPEPAAQPRLRQVSILFADIVDSTALLQRVAAEEALEVVAGALERFAAAVREAGGEVLRFTGDGLKAAFGVHGLREDEAEQAVRAGLGILAQARAHAERVRVSHGIEQFGVRVGVHTGPVVLGAGVDADRSAMGHAVHLAARMEQSAPAGRLRISHETWALVRGLFRVEPQPPLVVKGHDEPLTTYLVLGANADPERAPQRGVEGVATPMIGRDAELATLLALFDEVCTARRPAATCVVAEAGVGKTRLRNELLKALQARTGTAAAPRVLQARAHPSSALQPYGLVRQLVARWLGIADDLDADAARESFVQGMMARVGGVAAGAAAEEVAQSAVRVERLGHLLGLDFGSRPGVQALGARELREQGFAVLAEPAPALRALLIACAEGNPFYMEELLRMLIDDGVIDAGARPWRVRVRRLDALRVPETLVGVLQARLDALPVDELAQEALQLRCLRAALLPQDAARAEAHAVLDEAAADPRPHWRALPPDALLAAWQVLAPAGDPRAADLEAALQRRLDEQLAQFDPADNAARELLLQAVPWWRTLATLPSRSDAAPRAPEHVTRSESL